MGNLLNEVLKLNAEYIENKTKNFNISIIDEKILKEAKKGRTFVIISFDKTLGKFVLECENSIIEKIYINKIKEHYEALGFTISTSDVNTSYIIIDWESKLNDFYNGTTYNVDDRAVAVADLNQIKKEVSEKAKYEVQKIREKIKELNDKNTRVNQLNIFFIYNDSIQSIETKEFRDVCYIFIDNDYEKEIIIDKIVQEFSIDYSGDYIVNYTKSSPLLTIVGFYNRRN